MRRQIAAALLTTVLGVLASTTLAIAPAQCRDAGANTQPTVISATPATLVAGSTNAAANRQIYASIRDLMESIIDPSADVLWGAAGTVVDQGGIQDMLPKTQEEWLNVRRAAVRIIEGSNLLTMAGRDAAPAGAESEAPGVELEPAQITALIKKKRNSFNAFARALQVLGAEALRASETKDANLLVDIGGRMEDVCESCHQTFWYPQEKLAPAHSQVKWAESCGFVVECPTKLLLRTILLKKVRRDDTVHGGILAEATSAFRGRASRLAALRRRALRPAAPSATRSPNASTCHAGG